MSPPPIRSPEEHSYDVAFSYASEDREYVERVATAIQGHVRVFYDRHEQVDLWGKDLYIHLAEIYRRKSRLCVLFLSRHYAGKVWTNHERESAQARAFDNHTTHVLPARFDDTAVPGVSPAVAYIDLRSLTPEAFGALLLEKVRVSSTVPHRPKARARPWVVVASATLSAALVLGWAGLSGVSSAHGAPDAGGKRPDAGTARRGGGRVEQIVDADGRDSRSVLDGSMRVNRPSGIGDSHQEVRATNGGTATVKGDMVVNEGSGDPDGRTGP